MNAMLAAFLLALAGGDGLTIDRAITDRAGGPVAPAASDSEFIRRLTLDLWGRIPTAGEARAFLADKDAKKREKLIDRLLKSPNFARRMEEAFTVMLLERHAGAAVPDKEWRAFLRTSFEKDRPWNEVVGDILSADGRNEKTRGALRFFLDGRKDAHVMTRDVGRLFLGKDLQCAQCHKHPFVKGWRQSDYMGLHAYLYQSKAQTNGKTKKVYLLNQPAKGKLEYQSVFRPEYKKAIGPTLAGGKEIDVPVFKKGEEWEVKPVRGGMPGLAKFRPRDLLARDLATPENRQFVRTSVNRIWFLLMGRGLVHPLDMDHKKNPPSHPELLDALAARFVEDGMSVRRLVRRIVRSAAYQQSSLLPEGVYPATIDPALYKVAVPKPLSAEQMLRSVLVATGALKRVEAERESGEFKLKDYVSGKSAAPPRTFEDTRALFVKIFGNPAGEAEVEFSPSMSHALFLRNERVVLEWLKPREGNLVDRLRKLERPEKIAEELYLGLLARAPEPEESAEVKAFLEKNKDRRDGALGDLAWALLASAEFRFNH